MRMRDRQTLQQYINNFRRHVAPFLRPSIGVSCVAFPTEGPGAVIEFTMGPEIANEDHFRNPVPSVNDALAHIKQRAFGGNLAGFHFDGTNVHRRGKQDCLAQGQRFPIGVG